MGRNDLLRFLRWAYFSLPVPSEAPFDTMRVSSALHLGDLSLSLSLSLSRVAPDPATIGGKDRRGMPVVELAKAERM
jgi:hypothetical protein